MKTYSTKEINREFLIKVTGIVNGVKKNTLVGVSGLLKVLGSMEKLQKFVARAMKSLEDKVVCKVYGQPIAISFYRH